MQLLERALEVGGAVRAHGRLGAVDQRIGLAVPLRGGPVARPVLDAAHGLARDDGALHDGHGLGQLAAVHQPGGDARRRAGGRGGLEELDDLVGRDGGQRIVGLDDALGAAEGVVHAAAGDALDADGGAVGEGERQVAEGGVALERRGPGGAELDPLELARHILAARVLGMVGEPALDVRLSVREAAGLGEVQQLAHGGDVLRQPAGALREGPHLLRRLERRILVLRRARGRGDGRGDGDGGGRRGGRGGLDGGLVAGQRAAADHVAVHLV